MKGLEYQQHARDRGGRRARPHRHLRRERRGHRVERQPDDDGQRGRRAAQGASAAQGRPARRHRRVPAAAVGAGHAAPAAVAAQLARTRSISPATRTSDTFTIAGPFNPTGPGDTPSRRRIFICMPAHARRPRSRVRPAHPDDAGAARLSRHRPPTADVDRLMEFYREGREGRRIRERHQRGAAPRPHQPEVPVPDRARPGHGRGRAELPRQRLELASRLSFFLWSSIPDDAAPRPGRAWPAARPRRARAAGDADAGGSEGATRSCATSSASSSICATCPARCRTRTSFPTSTTTCAAPSSRRSKLFFDSIMREDRSVLDLLTANYTFVNERLARHYGMRNVYGSQFRRVALTETRTAPACSARAAC